MYTGPEVFRTNISQFVKYVHEVKLYVAYMRILNIDKIPPNSAACCIPFQFFTCRAWFYKVDGNSNRLQIYSISFTVETYGTGVRIY